MSLTGWNLRGRRVNSLTKSLQSGSIDLNSVTSATATIAPVDLNNSLLTFIGWNYAVSILNPGFEPRLSLTNATTVTAQCAIAGSTTQLVGWSVQEFWPGIIRQVQRGAITVNGTTSNTATILPVLVGRAILTSLNFTYNSGGNNDVSFYPRLSLTNASTITSTTGTAPGFAVTVGFQIVEFY